MNNTLFFKLAISTAFIAVPSVGCTQMGVSSASANVSADAQAKKALAWAQKSEKMLAKGQVDKALTYAEAIIARCSPAFTCSRAALLPLNGH
jgi:D-alanyl-D-alanine carboxypeptidase